MEIKNATAVPPINAPAPAAETQPAAPAETPKPQTPTREEIDFSRRFAALSKKERALVERELKLKPLAEFEKIRERAKDSPLDYLKFAGLTPEDLVQHLLKDGQPQSVEDKLQALQERLDAEEKRKAEEARLAAERAEQAQEQEAIDKYKGQIVEFLNQDTNRFEAITTFKSFEPVFDKIREFIEANGALPSKEEVEKIADDFENEIVTGLKTGLSLKKLGIQAPQETQIPGKAPQDTKVAPTLTNQTGSASGAPQKRKMSPEESVREAAKLLEWSQ